METNIDKEYSRPLEAFPISGSAFFIFLFIQYQTIGYPSLFKRLLPSLPETKTAIEKLVE